MLLNCLRSEFLSAIINRGFIQQKNNLEDADWEKILGKLDQEWTNQLCRCALTKKKFN